MIRNCEFVLTVMLLTASMGCTDRAAKEQQIGAAQEAQLAIESQAGDAEAARRLDQLQKARAAMPKDVPDSAPDIRDGWRWSAAEVAALTRHAKSGDMEAADRLHQYYTVHENREKMAYWENWLFKRGDPGAIAMRVHRLYSASKKRPSDDPRKLAELREAERLWILTDPDRVDNPFLDRLRSEIAAIEIAKPGAKTPN